MNGPKATQGATQHPLDLGEGQPWGRSDEMHAQSQDPWRVHDLVRSKPLDLIRYERATLCFKNHSTPKRFERKR